MLLVGLVGCTASETPTTPSASATKSGQAVASPLPTIPTGAGIIKDTTMTSCDTTGTKVSAKGTVTMPKGTNGDVVVSVSWTNSDSSSVYARGTTTLKGLSAGDSRDWSTSASLPPGAKSVSCVLGSVIPE
jgi:hypothetical protein